MKKHFALLAGAFASFGFLPGQTPIAEPQPIGKASSDLCLPVPKLEFKNTDPACKKASKGNARQAALKLESIRPLASKENARITLEVQIDWGDGSGYQILIDADGTAYGDIIPRTGLLWEDDGNHPPVTELYSAFEYKIPANATGTAEDHTVIAAGESGHIDIPAGTYDLAVVNPVAAYMPYPACVYIASGENARLDDYSFEAGKEYVFTAIPSPDMQNDYVRLHLRPDFDMAVSAIKAPAGGIELSSAEAVTVILENKGSKSISSCDLSYRIDGMDSVTEHLSKEIAPAERLEYTFATKADLSIPGHTYLIEASVDCVQDTLYENNTASADVFHAGPIQPPFFCDFDDEKDMDLWNIVNVDSDGISWEWLGGAVDIGFSIIHPLDDYLVTTCPIVLSQGDAHIAFEYNSTNSSYVEKLAVYYGTSADPHDMELLQDITITECTETMQFSLSEFRVEHDGEYYFAIHAHSDVNQYGIYIDNVEINQGRYVSTPDLAIKDIILPVSACDLSAKTPLQVLAANLGRASIRTLSLTFTLDGGNPVTEEFGPIPMGKDTLLVFSQTMDLSPTGQHTVEVEGKVLSTPGLEERVLENNKSEDSLITFTPLFPPFFTDFADSSLRAGWVGNWGWSAEANGYAASVKDPEPLFSRCVHLEEGKHYRFLMNHIAGGLYYGIEIPETFCVLYGLSGTDASTWDTLWNAPRAYEPVFVSKDASFQCEADGNYSFAIHSTGGLWIKEISVAEISDYDVRINGYTLPLARLTPADLVNTPMTASVAIQNRGLMPVQAKVEILNGTEVIGESETNLSEREETATIDIDFTLEGFVPDDEFTLTFQATAIGHEEADSTQDNELQKKITVTEDELAHDQVSTALFYDPDTYTVGADFTLAAGLPFSIAARDTLTAISIGWGSPHKESVVLSIHRWNAGTRTLGELIYENTVSAGTESMFVRYPVPGLLLEAGDYIIAEKSRGFILMTDKKDDGSFYVTSTEPPILQQGVGYPAIRAIFGSDGSLNAFDASVEEIVRPRGNGLFSANQEVEVRIRNRGFEEADIPVTLAINKMKPTTQIMRLAPYASGTLIFNMDMSAPSTEYLMTAATCLEGDEDPSNDTIVKVVRSLPPADPYIMNFEYCEDFAITDFVPAWTTIDMDGNQLGGWNGVDYPLMQQCAGFIAFNPSLTEPSLLDAMGDAIAPHNGDRFGASIFDYMGSASNDWLISPKLKLPADNARLSFYAKSYSGDYGLEEYNVYVSETDDDISSFVPIGNTREAPAETWEFVEINLSQYAGKEVHVAIQCVSPYRFMFMIDDIEVSRPLSNGGKGSPAAQLSLYPNPASGTIQILSSEAQIEQVSISNLAGSLVYESPANLDCAEFRYNVSDLKAGLYLAEVRTSQGTAVLKFIVR